MLAVRVMIRLKSVVNKIVAMINNGLNGQTWSDINPRFSIKPEISEK